MRLRVGKIAVAMRISRLACTAAPLSSTTSERDRERERRGEKRRKEEEGRERRREENKRRESERRRREKGKRDEKFKDLELCIHTSSWQ